jgi:deoxyribonuclease IV
MFGSHLSIAGSLCNALREAESLKMDTVQIFTKNQQQWKVPPLPDSALREWHAEVSRLGWQGRTAAHASYLINLASPSDELWQKSIDLMRIEIERCEALGIPFLVHHPGSPGAQMAEADPDFGIARIAAAYQQLFADTRGFHTICCLENTVGAGSMIGAHFEQLAALRARILETTDQPQRVGFCLDTCHAHAAGYDMSTQASAAAVLDRFDATCGLNLLYVLHLNDSKGALSSRLDRHEHIGKGAIGRPSLPKSGFATVVTRPELASRPKILETPKGTTPAGTPYDSLNLRRLRKLAAAPSPIMTSPARTRPRCATPSPRPSRGRRTTAGEPRGHQTSPP